MNEDKIIKLFKDLGFSDIDVQEPDFEFENCDGSVIYCHLDKHYFEIDYDIVLDLPYMDNLKDEEVLKLSEGIENNKK